MGSVQKWLIICRVAILLPGYLTVLTEREYYLEMNIKQKELRFSNQTFQMGFAKPTQ